MTEVPLVSLGLPVYQGERYLDEALKSIQAQTYPRWELVLCDNASTDGTWDIARRWAAAEPRIRIERWDRNVGAARNFNRTLERARGRYFKWFAHDDRLEPGYLESCVRALEGAGGGAVLCYTGVRHVDEEGAPVAGPRLRTTAEALSLSRLVRLGPSYCPAIVFGLARTDALRRTGGIGGFIMSDLVVVAELRMLGRFVEVAGDLFVQRVYPRTLRMNRHTLGGEAVWFDPRNAGGRPWPHLRVFGEYLASVRRLTRGGRRVRALAAISGYLPACLARGIRNQVLSLWTRVSMRLLATADRTSVLVRSWMLTAAALRRDRVALAKALEGGWIRGRDPIVLRFCVERLERRHHAPGDELLLRWLDQGSVERRREAARVVARSPHRFVGLPGALGGLHTESSLRERCRQILETSEEESPRSRHTDPVGAPPHGA